MKSIHSINNLNKSDFLTIFGNVFEKTDWIAEKVFELKPFKDFNDFSSKIFDLYENSQKKNILLILNSHPELAVAKKLTMESKSEQAGAKLNECSAEEFEEFKKLNLEYKNKFGFPFIIAVKGKNKNEILNNFRQRILNDIESEFEEAKNQVKKIATFRLNEIINQ
jgi:2-oxo-4-hydroxy-4-carboxy-5-ureidoimidazoline decarboxylase|tara:strand:+ start:71 stop:568 length:498 start_codon:yes stop_codon:yes gene_type:complete